MNTTYTFVDEGTLYNGFDVAPVYGNEVDLVIIPRRLQSTQCSLQGFICYLVNVPGDGI